MNSQNENQHITETFQVQRLCVALFDEQTDRFPDRIRDWLEGHTVRSQGDIGRFQEGTVGFQLALQTTSR